MAKPTRAAGLDAADTPPKSGIQSVEKAFLLLDALKAAREPVRLADLVAATGLSAALARAYLISLDRVGMVRQDPRTQRYALGEAAVQLGLAALSRLDFLDTARAVMQALRDETGETVWLSVWSERGPVSIDKVEGIRPSTFEVRIGSVADLTITATGQTFLAHLDPALWRDLLQEERRRLGALAVADDLLAERLAAIRRGGLATRPEVVLPDKVLRQFSSMTAPVFDAGGGIRAAMTLIGQTAQFDIAEDGATARALKAATRRLSAQLGHRPRPVS